MTNPSFNTQRILPIFLLVFVDVLGLTVVLPLLHLYAAAYGASPLEVALVAAAFPLAQLVGVPVMGALSDRYGRKPLLLISQITTCISFIMLGLANSLVMVVLSRVIDGLFGANIATAQAALSDVTSEQDRARGLGLTGAAFGLGFIFGPVIAILTFEFTDSLAMPAFTAATYSMISIFVTWFLFEETLPPEKRGQTTSRVATPFTILRMATNSRVNTLLVLMFAQQVVFFGFESLLGLFTLSQLGILGQGNAVIFFLVGVILVTVQARYIGRWSQRFGERKLVIIALSLLSIGLVLFGTTPEQPHPLYVEQVVRNELLKQAPDTTQAIIGQIQVELPQNENRGFGGILWVLIAIIPISIGAGLIRPSLNSLMTKRVQQQDYGAILGVSSAFVSLANASAPLIGGLIFQTYSATTPFLWGGLIMGILAVVSFRLIRPTPT